MSLTASLLLLVFPVALHGQKQEEFDEYKIRFDTGWFYSYASGTIRAQPDTYPIDLTNGLQFLLQVCRQSGLEIHSQNHLYVVIVPLWTSRTTTLSRNIIWAGNPIHAGAVIQSELYAFEVAPGYQYDIIRRRRGRPGLAVQVDLFHTYAKIDAAAQVTGDGTDQAAVGSAPLR